MKKQLLLLVVAFLSVVGASAQQYSFYENAWRHGNQFYTEYGAWDIFGDNLLSNGNFANNLTDWANADGEAATDQVFEVIPAGAADGSNCINVISTVTGGDATTSTTGELFRSVDLEAGTYVIGYQVRSSSGTQRTLLTYAGSNYQGLFVNNDGTKAIDATEGTGNQGFNVATKNLNYGDEWKEIYYVFTITEALNANICLYNLQLGDQFANFGVWKVNVGFDARPYQKILDEVAVYKANTADFPNNRGDLDTIEEVFTQLIASNGQGADQSMLEEANELLTEFLNANTYLLSADEDYFKNFLVTQSAGMNKGAPSEWSKVGGRWGTDAATSSYNLGHYTSNFAYQDIQTGYNLDKGELYREVAMPAGRYMFRAQVNGASYLNSNDAVLGSRRAVNFNDTVTCALFINKDTLWLKTSPTHYTEGVLYATLNEGEMLKFGAWLPGTTGNAGSNPKGGHQGVRPMELRLLGGFTKAQIDEAFFGHNANLQQEELGKRLATAYEMYNNSEKYAYGKKLLKDSIDVAQAVYDEAVVATSECWQKKLDAVNMIKKAWLAYEADNAEYTSLYNTMLISDSLLADPTRPVKTKLQAAYDVAKQFKATITGAECSAADSLAQKNGLHEQDSLLTAANQQFYFDNARKATPGVVTLQNPNYTYDGGWAGGNSNHNNSVSYNEEYGFRYNRNSRAAQDWFTRYQSVTVPSPGVYEFSATCAANKFGANYTSTYVFLETHQGGELDANNQYYYGTEENPILVRDSVMICTKAPTDDQYNVHMEDAVRLTTHVVVTDVTKPLVVGLNASRNSINGNSEACCQIIFGQTELLYLGDYDTYRADSIAEVMAPTKDALQDLINELMALKDEARNPNNVSVQPFTDALATAQNIHDNSNDFDAINAQFAALEAARQAFVISGVYPAEGKYYDLSFLVKNTVFETTEGTVTINEDEKTVYTVNDWTQAMAEGETFLSKNGVLYGRQLKGVEETIDEVTYTRTKLTQQVNNLPAGAYEFGFNATFHGDGRNEIFRTVTNEALFVTSPSDTVAAKHIFIEGMEIEGPNATYNDQNTTYLVYNEDVKLLLNDYRHGANSGTLTTLRSAFDLGYYLTMAKLDVAAGDAPELGFYLQNMPDNVNCYFFLANPQLFFFGDEASRDEVHTGVVAIEKTVVPETVIYNLAGQKLNGKAQKGIYIQNGKKYVIK